MGSAVELNAMYRGSVGRPHHALLPARGFQFRPLVFSPPLEPSNPSCIVLHTRERWEFAHFNAAEGSGVECGQREGYAFRDCGIASGE
jgi:hypothetical protein